MKRKTPAVLREPTEAEIQHAANVLWVENGRSEVADPAHGLAAEEMLCHRQVHNARTGRRAIEIAAPARTSTEARN